ncbi:hypothetical protein TIFTF001_012902 [Ficus carica]|uniref:Uncharacterized protein n=1 Tax=Ficus carica TaxID=3494 RepID=A0AA88A2K4_FICCA|nr:hypothetical protein TIFTF001_012902 [Ficus carica]
MINFDTKIPYPLHPFPLSLFLFSPTPIPFSLSLGLPPNPDPEWVAHLLPLWVSSPPSRRRLPPTLTASPATVCPPPCDWVPPPSRLCSPTISRLDSPLSRQFTPCDLGSPLPPLFAPTPLLILISAPTTMYVIHYYPSHLISYPTSADHTPFTNSLGGVRASPSCRSAPSTRVSRLADQNTRRAPARQNVPEAKGPWSPCPTYHTLPDISPISGRCHLPTPAARHIATRRHLPWQGLSLLTPAAVALSPRRPVAWRRCRPTRVQVRSHVTHLGYSVADPAGLPRAPEPAKGTYK